MVRHALHLTTDTADQNQPATTADVLEGLLSHEVLAPSVDAEDVVEVRRRDLLELLEVLNT